MQLRKRASFDIFRLPGTYISPAESGLYYLKSRYYDPETGRFVSADAYVSTGQGVTGFNMFAYCNDNPVNGVDLYGECTTAVLFAGLYEPSQYAAGGGIATLAFATSLSLFARFARWIRSVAVGISKSGKSVAIGEEKAEEKAADIAIEESQQPTIIYRWGGAAPQNLTPKEKDKYSGLSFSTNPRPGSAKTTIEALNATGIVYAFQDGPTHITVRPIGASVEEWINAGIDSVWTRAVQSVVIQWDGAR